MDLCDGLNINSFWSHSATLNSLSYMPIQIMVIAKQQLRISISPLIILCRYMCPSPQQKNDKMAAEIGRYDLVGVLFVMGVSWYGRICGYY